MEKQEKPEKKKKRFKIGLRTVKTVVAVFICCLIDFLRGTDPIPSSIAAVLCIQPDTKNSIRTGIRIIGTLIGGVTGALVLLFLLEVGISHNSILFYLILVLLIPVIYIPVRLGWPEASSYMYCLYSNCFGVYK